MSAEPDGTLILVVEDDFGLTELIRE